jgi:hypothetical protein
MLLYTARGHDTARFDTFMQSTPATYIYRSPCLHSSFTTLVLLSHNITLVKATLLAWPPAAPSALRGLRQICEAARAQIIIRLGQRRCQGTLLGNRLFSGCHGAAGGFGSLQTAAGVSLTYRAHRTLTHQQRETEPGLKQADAHIHR